MRVDWKGVFPAIATQFRRDLSIDLPATARHLDTMIGAGIHGVVLLGTVGENTALEYAEKPEVLREVKLVAGGRVPVLTGVAEYTTALGCRLARDAEKIGIDGLMVLPAMVYKSDPRETLTHFRTAAKATRLLRGGPRAAAAGRGEIPARPRRGGAADRRTGGAILAVALRAHNGAASRKAGPDHTAAAGEIQGRCYIAGGGVRLGQSGRSHAAPRRPHMGRTVRLPGLRFRTDSQRRTAGAAGLPDRPGWRPGGRVSADFGGGGVLRRRSHGLGGLDLSLVEGEIAGYAAVGVRERHRQFAAALERAFALRPELKSLPREETLGCRCEDVAFGRIRRRSGCSPQTVR